MLRGIFLFAVFLMFANVSYAYTEEDFVPYITHLTLGNHNLTSDFVIYGNNDSKNIYIPLIEFANFMLIPLKDSDDSVSGWIFEEANRIKLDKNARTLTIHNKVHHLKVDDFIYLYGDTYLSFDAMERFFPMEIKFDRLTQIVTVETKKLLPIEKKIAREEMLKTANKNQQNVGSNLFNVPLELQEYQMFSMPNMDFNYDVVTNSTDSTLEKNLQFSSRSHILRSILHTAGSARNGDITNMQLSLQRNDYIKRPFEHMLNPKRYWIGDIISNPSNLVSNAMSGVGFTVSNIPPGWKVDFNKLHITGYSLPNWSIEIYINNNLYDFADVPSSGTYSFQNIPLNAGLNIIKLVFYGPYGQRREVIEKVNLDTQLLQKGKMVYEVSALKGGRSIVESNTTLQNNRLEDGNRYHANIRYGLGHKTAIAFGTTSYKKDFISSGAGLKERHAYFHTSLTTGVQSMLINLDASHQSNTGSQAFAFSINTPTPFLSGSNLFVSSKFFTDNYISELRTQANDIAIKSSNQVRFTSGTNILGRYLSNIYTMNLSILQNGRKTYISTLRSSMSIFHFLNVSNILNINQTLNDRLTTASFNASFRKGSQLLVRGTLGYRPFHDERILTSSAVNINYNLGQYGVSLGFLRDLNNNSDNINVGINYNNNYFVTSASVGYGENSGTQLTFNIASGVVFSGVKPKVVPYNASTSGTIEVEAFLDDDSDGIKDFDEKTLSGVSVEIAGREMTEVTEGDGRMILSNIPVGSEIFFDVNTETMPDIAMQGGVDAKRRIILLSGATHKVHLPVIQVTEIDGNLVVHKGDVNFPIGNVQIKLIDKDNHIVQTTKSSSDGYYIFTKVPHGVYKVKIDDGGLKKYKDYLIKNYD